MTKKNPLNLEKNKKVKPVIKKTNSRYLLGEITGSRDPVDP